jgi:capsular polysaccharide transport system permease protein
LVHDTKKQPVKSPFVYVSAGGALVRAGDVLVSLDRVDPKKRRLRSFIGGPLGPLWVAFVATLFAAVYLIFFAASRFEVEARYVIRGSGLSDLGLSLLSNAAAGAGSTRTTDEAYIVKDFILSRDAVARLKSRLPLRSHLDAGPTDLFFRFPALFGSDNQEQFFKHYLRFVEVMIDTTSGISTLRVQAFSALAGRDIVNTLLDAAEALVNQLNQRAQLKTMETARLEVELARMRAVKAQEMLSEWRQRELMIDPIRLSSTHADAITRLTLELVQAVTQASELRSSSPRNPQIPSLGIRAEALRVQIAAERRAMAGTQDGLVRQIAEFEALVLSREFAERAYQSALSSLEVARRDSDQQKLFLERLVQPGNPDWAAYPSRWLWIFAVFGFSLVVGIILRSVVADTLSHKEGT